MDRKGKRLVIALGGNALGKTLPEQMAAVKLTAKAIADLVEDGHEIILSHGNGPQVACCKPPCRNTPPNTVSQPRPFPCAWR